MKRTMWIVAVVALCVAGSAVAEDRGGLIGSGTRTEDSGQVLGSGGFTSSTQDEGGGTLGSGTRSQMMGSGGRSGDGGQVIGSGGYFGSGLAVLELWLFDGLSGLVVSSDEGIFIIPIE